MAAPIFSGMAAFADNFQKAYGAERRRVSDEEDRAAERQWRNEQRDRQRAEWAKGDKLETALSNAAAPVALEQGANGMTKPDAMDNRDVGLPENATLPNAGLMTGSFKVGDKSFSDKAQADKVLATANSQDAVTERIAQAYRQNGKIHEATQMQAAAIDLKAKQLGLSTAEFEFADKQTRRQLGEALQSGKTWYDGAANFITASQFPGLKDVKAEPVLSDDGKTVTLVAVMPDGTRQERGTFATGEDGAQAFIEKFGALPLETRMSMMRERAERQRTQQNSDREYGIKLAELEIRAREAQSREELRQIQGQMQQLRASRMGGGGGAGGQGGGGQGGHGTQGMPDPMAGFDPKKAYATAAELAVAELSQGGQPATPDAIAKRATSIYRAMEGQFMDSGQAQARDRGIRSAARMAKTPQELQRVAQEALAAGYSPQELASIDPRLAPAPTPAPGKAAPAKKAAPTYDPALKAVVEAMAPKAAPAVTGPGTVAYMQREFQKTNGGRF